MSKPDRPDSKQGEATSEWTRLAEYLDLGRLWRRAGRRHRRRMSPRTEPSAPGLFSLGMLPFVLLLAALALLSILVIVTSVPGQGSPERRAAPPELGTAPPGWLDGLG
jgi:hypothetical protein